MWESYDCMGRFEDRIFFIFMTVCANSETDLFSSSADCGSLQRKPMYSNRTVIVNQTAVNIFRVFECSLYRLYYCVLYFWCEISFCTWKDNIIEDAIRIMNSQRLETLFRKDCLFQDKMCDPTSKSVNMNSGIQRI